MAEAFLNDDLSDSDVEVEEECEKCDGRDLLIAAEKNDVSRLEELLNGDSELMKWRDGDGYSALHRAAYNNNIEAMKVLLCRGAAVDAKTKDGWQPLHSAVRWNMVEATSLLLQNGADINAMTNGHQTPLHLAASRGDSRSMLLLLLTDPCIDATIVNGANETAYDVAYRSSKNYKLFEIVSPSINEV